MKKIYGCDIWDGLTTAFNAVVARPAVKAAKLTAGYLMSDRGKAHRAATAAFLGNAADRTGLSTAANTAMKGASKTWDFLSGNTLLKKHGGEPMSHENDLMTRVLGGVAGYMGTIITAISVPSARTLTGCAATLVTYALLGAATSTLPRNAYVACKAKKDADMKREAEGPQP